MYGWNKGGSLGWYMENSGLNAIELNASFYRFPFPNQVKNWAKVGSELAWAIKVNRFVTHQFKFSDRSYSTFSKFLKLFKPLENNIHFYLFQLPPLLGPNLIHNIEKFVDRFGIDEKFALEARNVKWFNEEVYGRIRELGITMVSTDSPMGSFFMKTSENVYLRIHGRRSWYDYTYSSLELKELAKRTGALKPKRAYIFFNNDHGMLPNSKAMMNILKSSVV